MYACSVGQHTLWGYHQVGLSQRVHITWVNISWGPMQHAEPTAVDKDNWFSTGDVASIDPLGFLRITDRSKDVIKSGGEWISSIEIENMAVSHEQVCLRGDP